MPENNNPNQRLTIRIGRSTLAFARSTDAGKDIVYEPYVVRSGISMAANLREAFKKSDLLLDLPQRVRVLLDTDVLLVPVELFSEDTMETMMHHAFPATASEAVCHNVLPDLNAVAVFAINRDLRLVLDDHFQDVQLIAAITPVWRLLHHRSYTGPRRKLYGYFHDGQLDVFSFQQNRFKFSNCFAASRAHDSLYFLLYVWKQLQLSAEYDEMHLVGDIPDERWLLSELKKYVHNAFIVNLSTDFGESQPATSKAIPCDLLTFIVKGR